jgi:hypothetical protein
MDANVVAKFSNLLYEYSSGNDRAYSEIFEWLDKEPRLLEACDESRSTPLIIAVYKENVRLVQHY